MSKDKQNDTASIKKKMQKSDSIFTDSVDGLLPEALKQHIVTYSQYHHDSAMALKNDEQINDTQELLAELKAPYTETLKKLKAKLQYLHILLKEKSDG
jgi:hypothetical protein